MGSLARSVSSSKRTRPTMFCERSSFARASTAASSGRRQFSAPSMRCTRADAGVSG
eukprot:CAMPEP_0118875536 /NCGR_PEP_ID=MMETSP1163-20130328/16573_1 /TAXON_ID=124430 /ORGANISM="Phaeomonas parva, Strain CCMP2877" /LENGTH=55 /DNA_ID=CAMNT_0006811055 /DNA_START=215 /DNA_END=382 /DNA_ORIENTATION=+